MSCIVKFVYSKNSSVEFGVLENTRLWLFVKLPFNIFLSNKHSSLWNCDVKEQPFSKTLGSF